MRANYLSILLLCGLMFSGWAHSQTWAAPLDFNTSPTYVSQENSCGFQWQQLSIQDTGDTIFAPFVVYRVTNRNAISRLNRPWSVQLLPQFGNLDFSIWVCDNHNGNILFNCSDASDNGPGMVNNVTVPGFYPGTHYIVVAGNIDWQQQNCGPYTLIATKH
jgi:hypothetical protein